MGIIMTKYTEWAEKLLEELMIAPIGHRVKIIESHLEKVHRRGEKEGHARIMSQSWEAGYLYAVENDWVKVREEDASFVNQNSLKVNTERWKDEIE